MNFLHHRASLLLRGGLLAILLALLFVSPTLLFAQDQPAAAESHHPIPHLFWTLPFVLLLLAIAVLPLIHRTAHWWESNLNRLIVSLALALVVCAYYIFRGFGIHGHEPGFSTLLSVLNHAVLIDYIPFIVLLFSLYVISGGIRISGDVPAHPVTNVFILGLGTLMASFIGTTGASMLLIRPLLQINSERKHVTHTVVFFIFLVSNVGGCLLPVGDPPLFLGYLRGVPFLWTLTLGKEWLICSVVLLGLYWVIDHYYAYRREDRSSIMLDETQRVPIRMEGGFNFALLAGVVFAVAVLVPGKPLPGTSWVLPNLFLREIVQIALAGLSLLLTRKSIRIDNQFNYHPIAEVAALFIGIFIVMQVPIEILQAKGSELGLHTPMQFFWATGLLSSFLDNAPTYVVFFETAGSMTFDLPASEFITGVQTATGTIPIHLLEAISIGAVFMGANTYIGNGPNFLVKSIAESRGVKMPSFFGYMLWSGAILIPIFIVLSLLFF